MRSRPRLKKRLVELGYNRFEIRGETAIIASGIAASYVRELLPAGVSFMQIGAYPIDEDGLGAFASKHEKVLGIEELAPEVGDAARQIAGCVPVFGKTNGYGSHEGELSPQAVAAIRALDLEIRLLEELECLRFKAAFGECNGNNTVYCSR